MKNLKSNLLCGLALSFAASSSFAVCNDQPIVFVHGYNSNPSTWDTMVERFEDYGYESCALYTFGYDDMNDSNRDSGADLADYVDDVLADSDHTSYDKVTIIAHSNGGLVSRWYNVFEGGSEYINRFITLGTPHDGTTTAASCVAISPACQNMYPGSGFLEALGSEGCDHAIWSDYDGVILPNNSAKCDGDGTSDKIAWSEGIGHSELLTKGKPWQKLKKALDM